MMNILVGMKDGKLWPSHIGKDGIVTPFTDAEREEWARDTELVMQEIVAEALKRRMEKENEHG